MIVAPGKHLLHAPLSILILVIICGHTHPCCAQARRDDDTMTLTVTVEDSKGTYVDTLTQNAFIITEDKSLLEITSFKHSNVLFYSVSFVFRDFGPAQIHGPGGEVLDELASHTGGGAIFLYPGNEIDFIFKQIALELRHQYSIGIKPATLRGAPGKWRTLKVKVAPMRVNEKNVKLYARTREGYYAP